MNAADLAPLITQFYVERAALLLRHEGVAAHVADYDVNNMYQYVISREETHASWLQHALLDLGAAIPAEPAARPVTTPKGADAWKGLATEDAAANAAFVETWRPRVAQVTHARHKGMLNVILGEMLEHKRLFDQGAAGRHDLIGASLAINDHPGVVLGTRWVE